MKKLLMILHLVFLLGFTFGCQKVEEVTEERNITVVIYGSSYGSTAQTAQWIVEGMEGKADVLDTKDATDVDAYRYVILGSGIYYNAIHEEMINFLKEKKEAIKEKIVAVFIVSGTPPSDAQAYLDMFVRKCDAQNPLTRAFWGWLKRELLTPEDLKGVEDFYETINQPFIDFDRTDKQSCLEFGKEILQAISVLEGGKKEEL